MSTLKDLKNSLEFAKSIGSSKSTIKKLKKQIKKLKKMN